MSSSGIRRRVTASSKLAEAKADPIEEKQDTGGGGGHEAMEQGSMKAGTYWLTRIVFIRSLGLIYCESDTMQ